MINFVIFLLLGVSASAAPKIYNLKMDLLLNGKFVSSPQMTVREGELASIESETDGEKVFLDVMVTPKKKSLGMTFTVSRLNDAGEKEIVSSPYIIARENNKAQISVSTHQMEEMINLSVIATRVRN
jgi:hypothetical protein